MLGDLPRSRPGRRSPKRESAPKAATAKGAARPVRQPPRSSGPPPSPRPSRQPEAEIVIGAARAAAGVARAGLQSASRIAGGVFGRLPRP